MREKEIYQKVRQYSRENQMLHRGDCIVVGVSGGADSLALLDLLYRMQKEWELKLVAVHVNHGIRGEEALRDQTLVENFCRERQIVCRTFCFDVPVIAQSRHMGIEEAGRVCREEAFYEVIKAQGERKCRIALAHNANDLAETMLHNLARGTGLRGLGGIVPVFGDKIRPVLCLERTEIEIYCKERNLNYITDSSNLEDHYTRNRIRHHVLPLLQEMINPEVISHFAETAAQAFEAEQFLQKQAEQLLEKQKKTEFGFLFENAFFREASILKSYAILHAMELLAGKRKDLTSTHVRDVLKLWERETSKKVMLPYGMQARKTYEGVCLEQKERKTETVTETTADEEYLLPQNGSLSCQWGVFETKVFPYKGEKIFEKKYTKWFDYDKIKTSLTVRTRRSGDFLVLNREGQKKKLKRYFIDEKFPAELRDGIPLLALDEEILWVIGGRINEKYKVEVYTRNVFQVEYAKGDTYERENQHSAQ